VSPASSPYVVYEREAPSVYAAYNLFTTGAEFTSPAELTALTPGTYRCREVIGSGASAPVLPVSTQPSRPSSTTALVHLPAAAWGQTPPSPITIHRTTSPSSSPLLSRPVELGVQRPRLDIRRMPESAHHLRAQEGLPEFQANGRLELGRDPYGRPERAPPNYDGLTALTVDVLGRQLQDEQWRTAVKQQQAMLELAGWAPAGPPLAGGQWPAASPAGEWVFVPAQPVQPQPVPLATGQQTVFMPAQPALPAPTGPSTEQHDELPREQGFKAWISSLMPGSKAPKADQPLPPTATQASSPSVKNSAPALAAEGANAEHRHQHHHGSHHHGHHHHGTHHHGTHHHGAHQQEAGDPADDGDKKSKKKAKAKKNRRGACC